MLKSFLYENGSFEIYSLEHFLSAFVPVVLGVILIAYSNKNHSTLTQKKIILGITTMAAIIQIAKVVIKLLLGNFDRTIDLPLHLCNILPFLLLIAIISQRRWIWAILYFWIMAGTFQSLFTPSVTESLPHYEAFRYWIVHDGLVIAVLFPIFVWSYKVTKRDIFNAWIGINILGFGMMLVNVALKSNYMYMQEKPPGPSMYDLLGPWPWYILSLEFVSLLLFGILYLPFVRLKIKPRDEFVK